MCYAGLAAEHPFCGIQFTFEVGASHGAWGDHQRAQQLLYEHVTVRGAAFVGDDAYDRVLARLQRKTKTLVSRHRYAVERVARGLLDRTTLSSDEVEALVKNRPGGPVAG